MANSMRPGWRIVNLFFRQYHENQNEEDDESEERSAT